MAKITNTSDGPRGFWNGDTLVMLEAGESAEGTLSDADKATGFFNGAAETAEPGPLDGSVDDLTAHLATVDDADAVQALIDAETAGKSRKGAIAALEARRDELLA
jgi:hypothetical protein